MPINKKVKQQKCVWKDCPKDIYYDNLCEYHLVLVNYWFYELGGVKYAPVWFDLSGKRIPPAYPETADPDIETYRARYQKWANDLGKAECDKIAARQGYVEE